MKQIVLLITTIVLFGCATSLKNSLLYQDARKQMPSVEPGKSRVTIFRTKEARRMKIADAYIIIDRKSAGSIVYGSFVYLDIPIGKHVVSVNSFGMPACLVTFDIASNEESFLEIVPTIISPPGLIGIFPNPFPEMDVGAVEVNKYCNGYGGFAIRKVDSESATNKLAVIRQYIKSIDLPAFIKPE